MEMQELLRTCHCELRRQRNLVISVISEKGVKKTIFSEGWDFLLEGIPKSISDLLPIIHSEDQAEFEIRWRNAFVHHFHQQFEFRIKNLEGEYQWLLADLVPTKENFISGVVGTFIDVTERKCIQARQLEKYEMMDLVLNSLPAFVAYVDRDEKYRCVNRPYSEFLQKKRSELVGMTVKDIIVCPYLQQALAGEKVRYEIDILVNEKIRRCRVSLVPHIEERGVVYGVFVLVKELGGTDVFHSLFEDLERFLGHWQLDPPGMAEFLGRAMARVGYRNLPDFAFSFGTAYFCVHEICERIDFIYEHYPDKNNNERGKLLKKLVEISVNKDVICLKDKSSKRHRGIRMMLLRDKVDGLDTFSLRYFLEKGERMHGYLKHHWSSGLRSRPTFANVSNPLDQPEGQRYEDDFTFWNFRPPDELMRGVIVYPDSQAFYDLDETKNVADFIVLVSNLLGYNTKHQGILLI